MQQPVETTYIEEQLRDLQGKLEEALTLLKQKTISERTLGDWVPELLAIELSCLSKSTLFALRKSGKLTSSTISGKGVFYRRSDLQRLLDENEKK